MLKGYALKHVSTDLSNRVKHFEVLRRLFSTDVTDVTDVNILKTYI